MRDSPQHSRGRLSAGETFVAAWGVAGVLAILSQACLRLAPLAIEPIRDGAFSWWQWGLWALWVGQMVYSEGYRGFHRAFSPRVVARAVHLGRHPRVLHVVFAPFFCMGLFHASRKRLIVAWVMIAAIACLIWLVRMLDQPWRGLVDAGVVVGLAVGATSIVYFAARAFAGHAMPVPPDLPEAG